jgi:hypothetical protein
VANQLGRRNLTTSQRAALALELEKQLAIEAKKKEAERKSTLQKIEKPPLPVVHAAEQAAKMVGANRQYVSNAKQIAKDALGWTQKEETSKAHRLTAPYFMTHKSVKVL